MLLTQVSELGPNGPLVSDIDQFLPPAKQGNNPSPNSARMS